MAAPNPAAGAAPCAFPLELATGTVNSLLDKDLEALFSPPLSLERAQAATARRLSLISAQMLRTSAVELVTGLSRVLSAWWCRLCCSPSLSIDRLEPGALEHFTSLQALATLFERACTVSDAARTCLAKGGFLVDAALVGMFSEDVSAVAEGHPSVLALLSWWSDEFCQKRLSVTDPWGFSVNTIEGLRVKAPVAVLAEADAAAYLPLALSKGGSVNGDFGGSSADAPARIAFEKGHLDFLRRLMEHGVDFMRLYERDGAPVAMGLVRHPADDRRLSFLAELLRSRPEIAKATSNHDGERDTFLDVALNSGDSGVVEVALDAGAPLDYHYEATTSAVDGKLRFTHVPSLFTAIVMGKKRSLKLLIEKGKAVEGWREKYTDAALRQLADALVHLAISAYPRSPSPAASAQQSAARFNPEASDCLELVLSSGIVCPWDDHGNNALLMRLFERLDATHFRLRFLNEEDALSLLKRFDSAGFEVFRAHERADEDSRRDAVFSLPFAAAMSGQRRILDWSLSRFGLPLSPNADSAAPCVLSAAIDSGHASCALLLLEKYKVEAAYPLLDVSSQPVVRLLGAASNYTDAEVESILRALIARDRSLFGIDCFSEASLAEQDKVSSQAGVVPWNPVIMLTYRNMPRALELLLTSKLPGVAAMVNRPVPMPVSTVPPSMARLIATQIAANHRHWECLSVLMRHSDASVSQSFADGLAHAANAVFSSARTNAPDRASRLMMLTVGERYKREEAEAKARAKARGRSAVATASAGAAGAPAATVAAGISTNAFEDPSLRLLTEAEQRRKAKKKAAKKKSKAKKRAVARAGAGEGGAAGAQLSESDSSSDDDDEETFEEPDDNLVDSRYAPSLDLMLEQMGLTNDDSTSGGAGGSGAAASDDACNRSTDKNS